MSSTEIVVSDTLKTEAACEKDEETTASLNSHDIIHENAGRKSPSTAEENNSENPRYFNGVEISKLTKRQMKKYLKTLKWEARKKEKRANERLKVKKRKLEAKLNNIDLGPSRKQLKKSTMANSPCKIGVVLDLSFDHLMISKVYIYFYFCFVVIDFKCRIWVK